MNLHCADPRACRSRQVYEQLVESKSADYIIYRARYIFCVWDINELDDVKGVFTIMRTIQEKIRESFVNDTLFSERKKSAIAPTVTPGE